MLHPILSVVLAILFFTEITGFTVQKHICRMEKTVSIIAIDGLQTKESDEVCSCLSLERHGDDGTDEVRFEEPSCCTNISSFLHFDYKTEFFYGNKLAFNASLLAIVLPSFTSLNDEQKRLPEHIFPDYHAPPLSGADFIISVHQIKIPDHC